jgi:molybdopterin molybdotransferase
MALTSWRDLARAVAGMAGPVAGAEIVSLRAASGRILAADVAAASPLPASSHAVMDGYALGSAPPGAYRLAPGAPARLAPDEAAAVTAGETVPDGAVAVVLADKAEVAGTMARVRNAQAKDNIRRAGEEAQPGAAILTAGARLDARHAALAAAAGVRSVSVRRRPRVALLALSDGPHALPHLAVAEALLASPRLALTVAGAVRSAALARALARLASAHDLVVVVGDSVGDEAGPLAAALHAEGGEVRIRRAAMKPAKPVATGRLGPAAILGLSGTAYAVTVAMHLFLRPLLLALSGLPDDDPLLPALARFDRARGPGRAEALPVHSRLHEGRLVLTPAGRFGQLSALAALDGFAMIEAEAGDMAPGASCRYHPLMLPLA